MQTTLEQRDAERGLESLAEIDPISAEQMRRATRAAGSAAAPPDAGPTPEETVRWCRDADRPPPDIVVVLGADNGGALPVLLEHVPAPARILLLESQPERAAALLERESLVPHVRSGRLVLALGDDEDYVETRFLSLMNMRKAPAVAIFELQPTLPTAQAFYYAALKRVRETVHLQVFNIGTMVDRGALWQHNTLRNLPYLVSHPGVKTLEGLFRGKPALVLGAGPSLSDTLALLPGLADRFVIISTGTALRPARRAGVRPDLVVAVDGSHKTAPQFEVRCDDLYLACSSLVYPPILPKFRGLFSASMIANPLSRWLDRFGTAKGGLIAAGTVTTSALDLAVKLGCNPVLVTGFDLSFAEDGTTHATHTMYHGSKLDPARLVRVPGNAGRDVPTTEQFRCYILLAEEYLKGQAQVRFVNVTRGGARIKGLDVLPPEELASLAAEPFSAYERIREVHDACDEDRTGEVRAALETIQGSLGALAAQARRAAMLCNRLILLLKCPRKGDEEAARDLLEQLALLDEALTGDADLAPFLEMSLWPAGYSTGTARNATEERYTDAVLVNARSRALYEQMTGAAMWTRDLLGEVMAAMAAGAPAGARAGCPGAGGAVGTGQSAILN